MRSLVIALTWLFGLLIVLAECGGSAPSPTPASPAANISLTTSPNPPKSGNVELAATVNDASGQPITDADVFIFANHTEMSGMSMNGKATAQGSGRYAINATLSMSGKWKVTVQVKKRPLDFT